MKNRLDKFFKNKMDQRSFEYQDAYWKDMEKILDQNEAVKSRRRPGLWLMLLIFFISASFVVIHFRSDASDTLNEAPQHQEYQENIFKSSLADNSKDKTSKDSKNNNDQEELITNNTTNTFAENRISTRQETNNFEISKADENIKIIKSSNLDSSTPNMDASNPVDFVSGDDGKISSDYERSKSTSTAIFKSTNDIIAKEEQNSSQLKKESLFKMDRLVIDDLSNLSLLKGTVNYQFDLTVPQQVIQDRIEDFGTKVIRRSRFNVGFQAGLSTTTELYGFNAGPTFRFDINPVLNIQTGLQYNYLTGISPITKKTQELEYGFRAIARDSYLKAKSFHFIELPVSINYKLFNHNFGIGAEFRYLVGIRGDIAKVGSDSGEMMVHQNWIVTDGFNRIIPSIGLVYGYDVGDKMSLQFNLGYGLKNFVDTTYEVDNEIDLGMNSRIWSGMKLTYYLRK